MITVRDVLGQLQGVTKTGNRYMALCPTHEDKTPSLSISEGEGGKVLTHCYAGCTPDQVRSALHLTGNGNGRREIAAYDYCDETGNLLYQSVRLEPKDFLQRRPDGSGGWEWKLNGVRRVPYRLRELLAADHSRTVLIVEGEKDCDRLVEIGLVATTNAGGAGKWRDEYNEPLRGRKVVIFPDNDEPGRKHTQQIATSLQGKAASVKIIELPGLPEKGDVTDWLNAGNGIKELRELVTATPEFEPKTQSSEHTESSHKKAKSSKKTRDDLFANPEPWPEPVRGDEWLNETVTLIKRYVDASEAIYRTAALWVLFTHTFECFFILPMLLLVSPTKRSGKTTLLQVLGAVVARSLMTSSVSSASLFRAIEEFKPTILIDEADTFLNDSEELRGILNSGHTKATAVVIRCDENLNVKSYSTFAPKLIAMIGKPRDTIIDRSIRLEMKRARSNGLEYLRVDKLADIGTPLRSRAVRFALDNEAALRESDPDIPAEITNARARDNWRALLSVADVCGGDWPALAREAARELSGNDDLDNESIGEMLLADIRQVFIEADSERIFSKTLVQDLVAMADRPWPEANRGKAITEAWLARRLKPFGVLSNTLRLETGRAKGYEIGRFQEAFARYLPGEGVSNRDNVTTRTNIDENENSNRDNEKACHALKTHETRMDIDLSRCHASEEGVGETYREPTREEWRAAAADPGAWDRLVTAAERQAIEHEESLA